jgi:hypothetical protein
MKNFNVLLLKERTMLCLCSGAFYVILHVIDSSGEEAAPSSPSVAPWMKEAASRRRLSNLSGDHMEVDEPCLSQNGDEPHAQVVLRTEK